jgi:hypothetical protein
MLAAVFFESTRFPWELCIEVPNEQYRDFAWHYAHSHRQDSSVGPTRVEIRQTAPMGLSVVSWREVVNFLHSKRHCAALENLSSKIEQAYEAL